MADDNKSQVVPTQSESVKMDLQHDMTTNGKTFKAGRNVEVPRAMADDFARRDYEYGQYEQNLMKKRTSEVNAGSFAMGGGAG